MINLNTEWWSSLNKLRCIESSRGPPTTGKRIKRQKRPSGFPKETDLPKASSVTNITNVTDASPQRVITLEGILDCNGSQNGAVKRAIGEDLSDELGQKPGHSSCCQDQTSQALIQVSVDGACAIGDFPSAVSAYPTDFQEARKRVLDGIKLLESPDDVDTLVSISYALQERNIRLLERIIHCRGANECKQILEEALIVEAQGGMHTDDGKKKSPGGVFLKLLQKRISREDRRFIWDEQNREQRSAKRKRQRSAIRQ